MAGHRQFGLSKNQNETFSFYTRAVDMLWDIEDLYVGQYFYSLVLFVRSFFEDADKIWSHVMGKVAQYINSNGGKAKVTHRFSKRMSWEDIDGKYK